MSECVTPFQEEALLQAYKVFGVIFTIYAPIILLLNILLVISLLATKQSLKNTSNLLIICLSISDGLIGALLMPIFSIEHIWNGDSRFCSLQSVSMILQLFLGGNSMAMTTLLAIDRYLHMNPDFHRSPSRFAKLFERPRVFLTIIATSSFIAVISLAYHFTMEFKRSLTPHFTTYFTVFMVIIISSFITIYTRGYLRIRRHVAENQIYANRSEQNSTDERPAYLKELFKTVLLLLIGTLITWTPILVTTLLMTISLAENHSYLKSNAFMIAIKICYLCFYSNAAINAFIIFYRNKKSKEWLFSLLRSCFTQRTQQVQNNPAVVCNIEAVDIA